MDMTLEEQGAYRNLLDEASLRGGPIPNDERLLAKACGDATRWPRVRATVMARFVLTSDGWRNETLDEVIRESQRRKEKQQRWRNKRGNGDGNATGNESSNDAGNRVGSPDPDPSPSLISGSGSVSVKELKISTRRTASHLSADAEGRFSRFWECYPNKKGKDAARKAWQKCQPSEALTEIIIAAVCEQVSWPDWKKDQGQFVPHPATWLNRGSWDDEPTIRTVPAWTCPSDPPCLPGTSGFRCHQRAQLEAAKRERTA